MCYKIAPPPEKQTVTFMVTVREELVMGNYEIYYVSRVTQSMLYEW